MATTMRVVTTVLPDHTIAIAAPELPVGAWVEVTVTVPAPVAPDRQWLRDFLASRPPSQKTEAEWEQFERDFQEERNSWDR
jgi:hypothetical protein